MNWVGNWDLWSAVRWSDIGGVELDTRALWLNRLGWLAVGAMFIVLAVRFFPRRSSTRRRSSTGCARARSRARRCSSRPGRLAPAVAARAPVARRRRGAGKATSREAHARTTGARTSRPGRTRRCRASSTSTSTLDLEPREELVPRRGHVQALQRSRQAAAQIPVTAGLHFEERAWTIDGETAEPEDRAGLSCSRRRRRSRPAGGCASASPRRHVSRRASRRTAAAPTSSSCPPAWCSPASAPSIVPMIGYHARDRHRRGQPLRREGVPRRLLRGRDRLRASATTSRRRPGSRSAIPEAYTANSVGTLVTDEVHDGVRTVRVGERSPRRVLQRRRRQVGRAPRRGHGDLPPPDAHLQHRRDDRRRSTARGSTTPSGSIPIPGASSSSPSSPRSATYAQGFPTNITFSEGIGFLTKSDPQAKLAFLVTAHEAAHQWWGNLLVPGKGPGGNILSEGMAHFSTILLIEQVHGLRERIEFCKRIEAQLRRPPPGRLGAPARADRRHARRRQDRHLRQGRLGLLDAPEPHGPRARARGHARVHRGATTTRRTIPCCRTSSRRCAPFARGPGGVRRVHRSSGSSRSSCPSTS